MTPADDGTGTVIDGDMPGTGDTGPICDAGPSQACVDARQTELEVIEADDDATVGDRNAALMALADAQTALSGANAADTVSGLIDDAMTATADITDESTPAAVAVGRAAIDAAQESLDGARSTGWRTCPPTLRRPSRAGSMTSTPAIRRLKWRCDRRIGRNGSGRDQEDGHRR